MAEPTRGRFRDALRHRDLRLIVAAFLTDGLGNWAYSTVLIVYVYGRTDSTTWIALTTASRWLPALLLSSYAGVLADRYERTRLMVASALASAATMVLMAAVVAADGPVGWLLVLSAVSAVAYTPYRPAAGALTPDLVGEKDLAAANGLFAALESLVVVVGPGVGALLLLTGQPVSAFLLNAATFVVAAGFVARTRIRSHGSAGGRGESTLTQFTDGVRALLDQRVAAVLVALAALDSAIYGASTVLYVPISQHLRMGTAGYGYLLAGMALGGVLAAGMANRLSSSRRLAPVIFGGLLLQSLPFAVTAFVHYSVAGVALQVVSGVGMIVVDVLALTALQRDIRRDVLSRVLSLLDVAMLAATIAASFVFSVLYRTTGVHTSLLILGLGLPTLALLGLPPLLVADRRAAARVQTLAPRVTVLQALDLFAAANRPTLERLAQSTEELRVGPDEVVMHAGDLADALWILVAGEVEASTGGADGREHVLRTVEAPGYVGEIGLLHARPRTATVRTTEPTVFWKLPGEEFLAALQDSAASTSLIASAERRLARSHPRLTTKPDAAVAP